MEFSEKADRAGSGDGYRGERIKVGKDGRSAGQINVIRIHDSYSFMASRRVFLPCSLSMHVIHIINYRTMDGINRPRDNGRLRRQPMPTVGSFLACVVGVYIFVRGLISVLHQLTCTLIRKLEGRRELED